jgi:hypothetical protein
VPGGAAARTILVHGIVLRMAPTQLLSPTTVPATKAIKKKVPLISSKHGRVPMVLTCFETKLENTGFGLEDLSLIRYQAVGP